MEMRKAGSVTKKNVKTRAGKKQVLYASTCKTQQPRRQRGPGVQELKMQGSQSDHLQTSKELWKIGAKSFFVTPKLKTYLIHLPKQNQYRKLYLVTLIFNFSRVV